MKAGLAIFLCIITFLALEFSILPVIVGDAFGVSLLLMAILVSVLMFGFERVWVWSIVAGLLYDIVSYATIGTHLLAFIVLTYITSFFSRRFSLSGKGLSVITLIVLVAGLTGVNIFLILFIGNWGSLAHLYQAFLNVAYFSLKAIAWNVLIFFAFFFLLRKLQKKFSFLSVTGLNSRIH